MRVISLMKMLKLMLYEVVLQSGSSIVAFYPFEALLDFTGLLAI